ncbi:pectinesterase family protein [Rhodothermus marinus]|uniref:pectinesterase family protein n=1 Tax=Rhodothermus marinus TaxID=29549 RepID=UPI0012BA3D00|nr:pectinesterase family protein [Rhodothermus marinus]BBM73776.1 hypothetical protein RmaAA338_26410 [Rhodothermus marinus]
MRWCRILLLGLLPLLGGAVETPEAVRVRVENPSDVARPDELVELAWAPLAERLPALTPEQVRVRDEASGRSVLHQVVDNDGDGRPDVLLFLVSLWPREARTYRVEAAAPETTFAARAFAYHEPQRDDVAWESDRVAYRTYGQGLWQLESLVSSGIDVWLKRVRNLVITRWYAKGHDAYHIDTGEGADFFSVGQSLGAGGTAIWHEGRLFPARNFKSYRILAAGPLRAIVELHYEPWEVGGRQVSEVRRITIDAGQYLFREEVTFRAADSEPLTYAIGLVKREGVTGAWKQRDDWTWLGVWGPVERKNGGHGELGTAVLMPGDRLEAVRETNDHYLLLGRMRPGETVVHYAGAGWTAAGDFRQVEDWWAYLDRFVQRLREPLRVAILTPSTGALRTAPDTYTYAAVVDPAYVGPEGARVDGVRRYRTIGRALADVPADNDAPYVIFVRRGRYHEKLSIDRPFVYLIGEDRETTVLSYDDVAGGPCTDSPLRRALLARWQAENRSAQPRQPDRCGTRGSFTLRIAAPAVRVAHLTVENAFDYPAYQDSLRDLQAVAVLVDREADRTVFYDCVIRGYQDTLFVEGNRSYFRNCTILGHVDFIFGGGTAVFEACDLISRDRGRPNNGYVVAPSTPRSRPYGLIFYRCRLLKESPAMAPASVWLGRPWHPSNQPGLVSSNAVFLHCYMDDHIRPEGWTEMHGVDPMGERLFEYGSSGPGAHPDRPRLTAAEAVLYAPVHVLAGWTPWRDLV